MFIFTFWILLFKSILTRQDIGSWRTGQVDQKARGMTWTDGWLTDRPTDLIAGTNIKGLGTEVVSCSHRSLCHLDLRPSNHVAARSGSVTMVTIPSNPMPRQLDNQWTIICKLWSKSSFSNNKERIIGQKDDSIDQSIFGQTARQPWKPNSLWWTLLFLSKCFLFFNFPIEWWIFRTAFLIYLILPFYSNRHLGTFWSTRLFLLVWLNFVGKFLKKTKWTKTGLVFWNYIFFFSVSRFLQF